MRSICKVKVRARQQSDYIFGMKGISIMKKMNSIAVVIYFIWAWV
jgi:hypothetical protein